MTKYLSPGKKRRQLMSWIMLFAQDLCISHQRLGYFQCHFGIISKNIKKRRKITHFHGSNDMNDIGF